MSISQQHTTASLSDKWRTVNIDALDPESSQNFDIETLHGALPQVSEAEARQIAAQVRQLLRGGDAEGALRGACESAPAGASEGVKEIHLQTITEVLQSIKASDMTPMLQRIYGSEGGSDVLDTLMKYLARYLKSELAELNRNNVQLETIGQLHRLPEFVQKQFYKTQEALAKNNGLTLVLALSYGGRTEIVEAVRKIAAQAKNNELEPADITEKVVSDHLYTRQLPDPDVLIRTSGEMRLSNFLLWQISYAELVVTQTLWPDFRKPQFFSALEEYAKRHRRFGGV